MRNQKIDCKIRKLAVYHYHLLDEFQKKIGIKFKDVKFLETALTHRSYLNEVSDKSLEHNERLEFLGDAVLELVVTEYLYRTYPNPEGELTAWRSALVKGEQLAAIARELNLGRYLRLSKGEERSGGRSKAYLLANAFEATLGALYLDAGLSGAKKAIAKLLLPRLARIITEGSHIDAKSRFQELAQERKSVTPEYRVLSSTGPDHAKEFEMGAYFKKELIASGKGPSKQAAEQAAARAALTKLGW